MKHFLILSLLIATFTTISHGQSAYEREFKQLTEQRDKAVLSATQAINQNYQKSLRQLLLRATNNDGKAIAMIAEAMKGGDNQRSEIIGNWAFKSATWSGITEVKPDGTIKQNTSTGTWTATDSKLRWTYAPDNWIEFPLPVRDGKITGVTNRNERMTWTKMSE